MSKTTKDLMGVKLNNFKHLICINITNDENENFVKFMEFDVDKIITFYLDNIRPNLMFGPNTLINSFLYQLDIIGGNPVLIAKIEQYFSFFEESIRQLEMDYNDETLDEIMLGLPAEVVEAEMTGVRNSL